MNLLQRICI